MDAVLKKLYSHLAAKIEDYMIRFDTDDEASPQKVSNKQSLLGM